MEQESQAWGSAHHVALEHTWGEYRTWAATAREQKKKISRWQLGVLILTFLGAVLGTLSQSLKDQGVVSGSWSWVPTTLSVLSAIAIGLVTLFTREYLAPESERRWVRARALAEALKSEVFRFRAGIHPYTTSDAPEHLIKRTQALLDASQDMQADTILDAQRRKDVPTEPLSIADYIVERVDNQINQFYLPKAKEYEEKIKLFRRISIALGIIAVILGAIGISGLTAGWIAVITTATTSIAAYLYSSRYEQLIVSYQAAARQLSTLRTSWVASGSPAEDIDKRNQFVTRCEEVLSIENNAWMAHRTKQNPTPDQPSADTL